MEAAESRSCRVTIRSKAKNFDLKLRATTTIPPQNFFSISQISLLLKIRQVRLKVRFGSTPTRSEALKSKFSQIIARIRHKFSLNNIVTRKRNSISKRTRPFSAPKNRSRGAVHVVMGDLVRRKYWCYILMVSMTLLVCLVGFSLKCYFDYWRGLYNDMYVGWNRISSLIRQLV
ncbi:hypothetical protein Sjap_014335 [Stephania japonica]|uniref:Uncharacterized protein n=1 Tax=Stephania japonica TaxID=461633 RepID=A0AAP0NZJ5_9MAGN